MRSFGQKILFDFNHHKFAMTDKGKKDVIGIVKFDRLIMVYFPPIQQNYYTPMEYLSLWGDFSVLTLKSNNAKKLKFYCQKSSLLKHWQRLSGRFHTLIWRPGDTVQNLESPRCWQHCVGLCVNPSGTDTKIQFLYTLLCTILLVWTEFF